MLTGDEKRELLRVARNAVECAVEGVPMTLPAESSAGLQSSGGAFVTLRLHHSLRGCIGYILSELPLVESVADAARKAAMEDPRFRPLSRQELPEITLEVSVLSPPRRVASPEDIIVGQDGLILEIGKRRGLLLPQVAEEYGWSREEFLEAVCEKAGVAAGSWRLHGAALSAFRAEVFHEEEM